MKRTLKRNRGFTLLELLVAFSLMGLIALLLVDGVKFGNRVWEGTQDQIGSQNQVQATRMMVESWLASAYPAHANTEGDILDFSGETKDVAFVSSLQPGLAGSPLARIRLTHDPSQKALIVGWEDETGLETYNRLLLEGIKTLEISYFGMGEEEETGSWKSEWKNQPSLPALIKIELQFAENVEQTWIPLVIKPTLEWGADCSFDATTGKCRRRIR